uniref:Uncharacterized protein n=1 Tax=Panagrolaimus sp. PS1159 TaxID=55785 RepID=A0AC35G241_9BILA
MKVFFIFGFLGFVHFCYSKNAEKRAETCIDKFCPPGTFCATLNVVHCVKEPCKPLLACLPVDVNGCANHHCPQDMISCAALRCPPSHKCQASPKPKCVKTIFTESDITELDRAAEE